MLGSTRPAPKSPAPESTPAPVNWREHLRVHPAAELFPLMSEAELRELAEDIKANGLRTPIVIWSAGVSSDKHEVIDGRNKLDALERAGLLHRRDDKRIGIPLWDEAARCWTDLRQHPGERLKQQWIVGGDPYAIALSFNVHRRHLNAEQKRDLIANVLKAKPEKSNNQIAKEVKADDKTVAKVRADLESRSEIPNVGTRTDTKGRKQPAKRKAKVGKKSKSSNSIITEPIETDLPAPIEPISAEASTKLLASCVFDTSSSEDIGAYLELLGPDRFFAALQHAPTIKAAIERRAQPKPSVGEINAERIGKLVDAARALLAHPDQHKDEIKAKLASIKRIATQRSGTKIPEQNKPTLDNDAIARADVALKGMCLKTGGNATATEASADAAGDGEAPAAGSNYSITVDPSIPHSLERGAA